MFDPGLFWGTFQALGTALLLRKAKVFLLFQTSVESFLIVLLLIEVGCVGFKLVRSDSWNLSLKVVFYRIAEAIDLVLLGDLSDIGVVNVVVELDWFLVDTGLRDSVLYWVVLNEETNTWIEEKWGL